MCADKMVSRCPAQPVDQQQNQRRTAMQHSLVHRSLENLQTRLHPVGEVDKALKEIVGSM